VSAGSGRERKFKKEERGVGVGDPVCAESGRERSFKKKNEERIACAQSPVMRVAPRKEEEEEEVIPVQAESGRERSSKKE
jgi:hypothetical protein